jgi:hypothetical protein
VTARVLEFRYPAPSEVVASPTAAKVSLALESARSVGVTGRVNEPELFRDALLTQLSLRDSDLRYKGRDRAAYLAFLMKKGKKATKAIWEAQRTFLDNAFADETPRQRGLDPIVTVDPDEISFEVFSRDESAYSRLAFDNTLFDGRTAAHGTSFACLTPALVEQIERIRTYQPLELVASSEPQGARDALTRSVDLPDEWLRGFLQVQSAATLPGTSLDIAPVDFYNLLFTLRTRRAKKAPRGLRFELVPGSRPRLVVEPWEIALDAHDEPYGGPQPRIVRLYGRQRLLSLSRALPHLRRVRVHLLGAGLPSFWVLDMGKARMTVALTSWAESRWGSAASFDALMPRADDESDVEAVVALLRRQGPARLAEIAGGTGLSTVEARAALQRGSLRGQVLFDRDRGDYRPRAVLAEPVNEAAIRYGSQREAAAHRLLQVDGSVRITKLHRIAEEGTEISGEVEDKQARRAFAPRFTADPEGQVREAWCNCPTYQRSAMKEGPCEHMIALFVFEKRAAAEAERQRLTPEGRKLVRAETRTLIQRDAQGKQRRFRVTLDGRSMRVESSEAPSGQPLGEPRFQRLWFDSDAEARDAYFARLDHLGTEGFIDTDAMSA